MKNILTYIIENKIPCYFISPHLDDAILSAGGLIKYLSLNTHVELISVFTNSHNEKTTLSAKMFLRQTKYKAAEKLFIDRKKEDKDVADSLNIEFKHLNYLDALWRVKKSNKILTVLGRILPEVTHIYPTFKFHAASGKVSNHDSKLIKDIYENLKSITSTHKEFFIFGPAAVGNHVDHILIRNLCINYFSNNSILWSDFPYNIKVKDENVIMADYATVKFEPKEDKIQLIEKYKSQRTAMFGNKSITLKNETFYISNKLLNKII